MSRGILFNAFKQATTQVLAAIWLRCPEGLPPAVAVARMSQRILGILYQTLILSVIEYGFGLLTLSKTQLSRLEVV